jgi:hypothetical protein
VFNVANGWRAKGGVRGCVAQISASSVRKDWVPSRQCDQ